MKSILVTIAAILLTALSVSQSHADKCYWSSCYQGCLDDSVALGTQMRPRSKTKPSLCRKDRVRAAGRPHRHGVESDAHDLMHRG